VQQMDTWETDQPRQRMRRRRSPKPAAERGE
jgi:hypothetical protein